MGTTLTTLNVYGMNRSDLELLVSPTDLIRSQNPPWLCVLPSREEGHDQTQRLGKLAGKLTKQPGTAALLFYYFDDDMFCLSYYQDGRKRATCMNSQSWAKLGKKLNELFGSDAPSKAFRYAPHCYGLEEQLDLLEETLGTALLELPDAEPRVVTQKSKTLSAIKAREALIRKRPDQFRLSELPSEEWPDEMRYRETLLKLLRPRWFDTDLPTILRQGVHHHLVPGARGLVAYPWFTRDQSRRKKLCLFDASTGEYGELGPFGEGLHKCVWRTKQNELCLLFVKPGRSSEFPTSYVSCVAFDGTARWRFAPELDSRQYLFFVHSSAEGLITLMASGFYDEKLKIDSFIWQIDGETGKIVRMRRFPVSELNNHVAFSDGLNAFVYCKPSSDELVVLGADLEEKRRFNGYKDSIYDIRENLFCGNRIWNSYYDTPTSVSFFDLTDGTKHKTILEVPVYPQTVLSDGRIIGCNEQLNKLIVFDRDGKVIARCSVPGFYFDTFEKDGNVCIAEVRGPDTFIFTDSVFDETTTHVWRLDKV